MNKLTYLLGILALPACCISNTHPETTVPKLTLGEHLELKTVALVEWASFDEEGNVKQVTEDAPGATLVPVCSGVWINDKIIVTAAHCVSDIGEPVEQALTEQMFPPQLWHMLGIKKWDPTGQPLRYSSWGDISDQKDKLVRNNHPAIVYDVDWQDDLALIKVMQDELDNAVPTHEIAALATDCHVGDHVNVMGHPARMWWSYTNGVISQLRENMKNTINYVPVNTNALQISAPIWFGNSGGGTFNDKGELLGIVSWLQDAPETAFVIRYDKVAKLLREDGVTAQ